MHTAQHGMYCVELHMADYQQQRTHMVRIIDTPCSGFHVCCNLMEDPGMRTCPATAVNCCTFLLHMYHAVQNNHKNDICLGVWLLHVVTGLYNPEATKDTIIKDFLVFCKLAVNHGVVPPGWDWSAFLSKAAGLLGYAFEKEDAKDKWGGENVFSAMMGGRSLRYTGEVVYGSSCMAPGNPRDDREKAAQATLEQYERQVEAAFAGGAGGQQLGQHQQLFAEVGGLAAWQQLCRALRFNRSEHVW
jgi:hypothetical protein